MDNYISKFTFFDIMAMLIPGGLITVMMSLHLGYGLKINVDDSINSIISLMFMITLSYLVGLIHHTMMDFLGCKLHLKNNEECIYKALTIFQHKDYNHLRELTKDIVSSKDGQGLLDKYYEAYYYVERHSRNNHLHIIEAQVTLVRNMLIPLIALFFFHIEVFLCEFHTNNCCTKCFFAFGIICLFIPLIYRQKKIHKLVWEDYEFLKRLEYNEKNYH